METASFTGLVKAIFTIMVIYYIAKFLMRLFLPAMAQQVVRKAQQDMENQRRNYEEQRNQQYTQQQYQQQQQEKPKDKPVVGEYIDFEELD